MTETRRNAAIDLLRGGSILYIVGYWHLLGYVDGIHGYKNAFSYRLTVVVLGLFTLMAGVLAGRRPIRQVRDVWRYYRARALRIFPPYALALALLALIHLLHWRDVALGLLLLPAFNGEPLRTLWYVNMLVLFYLLAPLLLLSRHRLALFMGGGRGAGLLLAVGTGLSLLLLLVLRAGGMDTRLGFYFPAFLTGLLFSAQILPGEGGQAPRPLRRLVPLATLAAGTLVLSLPVSSHNLDASLLVLPMATIIPALIVAVATRRMPEARLPDWLRATSSASYFMYLWHRPLFQGLKSAATALGVRQPGWLLLTLMAIGVPLIVWISWWGQRLYDRSLRSLGL